MLELNKIHHGDCLELMKDIPDGSIDLIVTDPPYLMNYRSNYRKVKYDYIIGDKDGKDLIAESIKEAYRVLKDNSAIYMFCSWRYVDFFKSEFENYFKLKNIIVWNKNNTSMGDLKGSYAPKHEFVLFGHKGRRLLEGFRYPDVLEAKRTGNKLHPTQKPIDLLEIFIKTSSKENDVVLDMFAGSGSTAIACINTNRFFIGIEKEKKYVDIANKRIEEHKKTGRNADISTFDFNHEECQKSKDGDDMKLKNLIGKYAFISHPYANNPTQNKIKVDKICKYWAKKGIIPISPLHMFSFYEDDSNREKILNICYKLIDIADVVFIYGDSEGCRLEKEYAKKKKKPIFIFYDEYEINFHNCKKLMEEKGLTL